MTLPPISFPTLGWGVIDWIEAYLPHGPGDVQGEPISVDDELAIFLLWAYRIWPREHPLAGRRLCQRAIFSRPKGRAKSEFAGEIVCAEALGPVRFDGWDAEGEPVGRPVRYPFIRCLATEEEQSGNTYDNVTYMLREGRVAAEYQVDVGLTRTFIKEPGGGEILPSTAAASSKDGGKETFAVADETHLYVTEALRRMYRTVARNTGKRKDAEPWMLDTTTAYEPGEHSVAETAAERYGAGDPEELVTKRGVLFDHRQGGIPARFNDDRSLIKAMREGYGPASDWMDFKRIVRIIRDADDPEQEAFRYWLNIAHKSSATWLSPQEISAALRPESVVAPGALIGLGFDGSENDDHTALFGCTREGLLFPIGVWTPKDEDDVRWHAEVDEAVAWAFDTFEVARFYCDPAWWAEEVSRWISRYGDHRRYGKRVAEFWTGGRSEAKFAVACGAARTGLRQGTTTLDPYPLRTEPQTVAGKQLVTWHFENARVRKVRVRQEFETEDAYVVRKEKRNSPNKIDSVAAAVLARRARDDAEAAGLFSLPQYGRVAF